MLPLTLEDLLPLHEYAARRQEFCDSLHRYLDRYRQVRIGPRVTLLFENRQTLWFRLHELIRVARLSDPELLQEELNWYNSLLPGRDRLQAAMLIEIEDEKKLREELEPWKNFHGNDLRLRIGDSTLLSTLVTCRPDDLAIGTAHWVQFGFDLTSRQHLADLRQPVYFELVLPSYRHQSSPLSDEVRQSLLEDLELSDRD